MAGTFTTGLAALALGGIAAALTAAQPLEVSLLERPGPATSVAPLPATIDPPSVREAARAAGVVLFAATRATVPDRSASSPSGTTTAWCCTGAHPSSAGWWPPRGAHLVRWAGAAPGVAPRVETRYLRTSGPGITVTERAAAPGTLFRRPIVVRDMPDGAVVRTVLTGTLAEVRGRQDALDDLLAVAASLRPVVP